MRARWESRKLFVAMSTMVLATWLLWNGRIEAEIWETITMTVLGSYMAAQGWIDSKQGGRNA